MGFWGTWGQTILIWKFLGENPIKYENNSFCNLWHFFSALWKVTNGLFPYKLIEIMTPFPDAGVVSQKALILRSDHHYYWRSKPAKNLFANDKKNVTQSIVHDWCAHHYLHWAVYSILSSFDSLYFMNDFNPAYV